MAVLECAVKSCSYNQDARCCKGDIMVGGKHARKEDDTCCESYRSENEDHYSSALDHPCTIISIDCEAVTCVYNSNYKCHAESVSIKGSNACNCKETACATFKEK